MRARGPIATIAIFALLQLIAPVGLVADPHSVSVRTAEQINQANIARQQVEAAKEKLKNEQAMKAALKSIGVPSPKPESSLKLDSVTSRKPASAYTASGSTRG